MSWSDVLTCLVSGAVFVGGFVLLAKVSGTWDDDDNIGGYGP